MKKETLADKLARKTFQSNSFRQSWNIHVQAFGPILEPAFAEDYQARVHLTAALNLISRQKLGEALQKLQALQIKCTCDADRAAVLFCTGVVFEMAGRQEEMLEYYSRANSCGHNFYLPYLKTAKLFLESCAYEKGAENFLAAIRCFGDGGHTEQERVILGAAYANYGTCLTMMHRYSDAEAALAASRELSPATPGRAAAEVILYALRGSAAQVEQCLEALRQQSPELYDSLRERTDKILARTDPLFFPVEVDETKIALFWQWFTGCEAELNGMLERREYEAAVTQVAQMMLQTFPFLEEQPYIALGKNEEGYILEIHDMYAVAVMQAYKTLLQNRPQTPEEQLIRFVTVH